MNSKRFAPFIKPLLFLAHDERFMVAIIAAVVYAATANRPALAPEAPTIIGVVVLLAGLLIGGYTVDNLAAAIKNAPTNLHDAIHDAQSAAIDDLQTQVSQLTAQAQSPGASPTETKSGPPLG